MKQISLKLLVCILLAASATGQYNFGQGGGVSFNTEKTDLGNYGRNDYIVRDDDLVSYNQNTMGSMSSWSPNLDPSNYQVQTASNTLTGLQTVSADNRGSTTPKVQATNQERYESTDANSGSHYGQQFNYKPYTEPTGPPYGIQSTGEILVYQPEKIDLSKCGPQPTSNPCKILGAQYFELPGYPACYIQCAFGRMFIKPCPNDLVWNPRIQNCDWKTVAPATFSDKNNALMHDNNRNTVITSTYHNALNKNYDIAYPYSYGRKKRSTVERKKRSLAGDSQQGIQFQNFNNVQVPTTYATGSLNVPLGQINLAGPASYPSGFGVANLPTQAFQQQYGSTAATQGTIIGTVVPSGFVRTTVGFDSQHKNNIDAPTGSISETANLAATSSPSAAAPVLLPVVMSPANPMSFNPYVAPSPSSLQVTLLPGPLYPYGPILSKYFGGSLPKPTEAGPCEKSSSDGCRARKQKSNADDEIIKHFVTEPVPTSGASSRQMMELYRMLAMRYPETLRSFADKSSLFGAPFTSGQNLFPTMSFTGQNLFPTMPFTGSYMQPDMMWLNQLLQSLKQSTDEELSEETEEKEEDESSPLGDWFEFSIGNKDASEENGEANSRDDKSEKAMKFLKGYIRKMFNNDAEEDDWISVNLHPQIRRKRQYTPYITAVEQKPAASILSYDSTKQQRLPANELLRQFLTAPSPCFNKPPASYTAHPTDSTKYIACFNQLYYHIMDCPSSLIYNPVTNKCEKRKGLESICEREQPCLNEGQCYQTSPKSYKCNCRSGWTGERCEIPMSACVNNPCGQGNECLTLKASNAKQDYVCVCNEGQSYGLSCGQNTKANPCLSSTNDQQYYPFEYSSQAYIQCNGDILYVQRCPPGLNWNQVLQVCDVPMIASDVSNGNPYYSYEYLHSNEKKESSNEPSPQINRHLQFQEIQSSSNSLQAHNTPMQNSLKSNNRRVLALDQTPTTDRSILSPKPLEKPDAVKIHLSEPTYGDIMDEKSQLAYLHRQTMRPLTVKR